MSLVFEAVFLDGCNITDWGWEGVGGGGGGLGEAGAGGKPKAG